MRFGFIKFLLKEKDSLITLSEPKILLEHSLQIQCNGYWMDDGGELLEEFVMGNFLLEFNILRNLGTPFPFKQKVMVKILRFGSIKFLLMGKIFFNSQKYY